MVVLSRQRNAFDSHPRWPESHGTSTLQACCWQDPSNSPRITYSESGSSAHMHSQPVQLTRRGMHSSLFRTVQMDEMSASHVTACLAQKLGCTASCSMATVLLLASYLYLENIVTMSPAAAAGSGSKRSRLNSSDKPAKRTKSSKFHVASDSLKWKPVKGASVAGFDEGGGMMMLEELDNVAVEWEEGLNGQKVAKFIVRLDQSETYRPVKIEESQLMAQEREAAPEGPEEIVKPSKKDKKGKAKARKPVIESIDEQNGASDDEDEDGAQLPTFSGLAEEDLNEEDEDVEDEDEDFDGKS